MKTWNERLKNTYEKKFKSVAEFARVSGVSKDSIHKYLKNGVSQPRGNTLKLLADALFVDYFWLKEGAVLQIHSTTHAHKADNIDVIPTSLKLAKIRGYVQAGDWREASEYPPEEMGEMYLKEIELYQNAYGLDVRGDSMNKKFNEGDTLVCVPIIDWSKEPISGQYVIALATCIEGLKEATVKRYDIDVDGHHWLRPDSTNPSHQNIRIPNGNTEALILNGRQITSVEVTAIVISRVENFI